MKMRKRRIHSAPNTRWTYGCRKGARHRSVVNGVSVNARFWLLATDLIPVRKGERFTYSRSGGFGGIAILYHVHRKAP